MRLVSSTKDIVKSHILKLISSTQGTKWKVLVIDESALEIVNLAMSMDDLLNENITVIEPLEKARRQYPSLDAIYIVYPTETSIDRIIKDLSGRSPLYSTVHLYFCASLDDSLFYKLKSSPARKLIKTLVDIPMDFLPLESRVWSLERNDVMKQLWSVDRRDRDVQEECQIIALQIASFWITLRSRPTVRYFKHSRGAISEIVAQKLEAIFDDYVGTHPAHFPAEVKRPELVITDRSMDLRAPLIHEFTYQAMATDLVYLRDGGRMYRFSPDGSVDNERSAVLDDRIDSIWASTRHSHIAQVSDSLSASLSSIRNKLRPGDDGNGNDQSISIDKLRQVLAQLPDMQQVKDLVSVHVSLAKQCMSEMEKRSVRELAEVEQDFAMGEGPDGRAISDPEGRMLLLLRDAKIANADKVRLLALYCLRYSGFSETEMPTFFKLITPRYLDIINGLKQFGVVIYRPNDFVQPKPSGKKWKPEDGDDGLIDLTLCRYRPTIAQVVRDLCDGTLSTYEYPYAREPSAINNMETTPEKPQYVKTPFSQIKPVWHKRDTAEALLRSKAIAAVDEPSKLDAPPLSVFMIGGACYSESRAVYEMSTKMRREVFLGTTCLISNEDYLRQLATLRPRQRK